MTKLHRLPFGVLSDGRQVTCHVLKNDYLSVSVLDYGLRLSSVKVKRRQGNPQETVLGFNSLKDYEQDQAYIGAVIGRYANRIRNGRY
ncbi:MAG TPA: galactose-1-epimerase, partial [Pseudomonadales bacterium]|nr:galactose-1-epimerase [Pseudomonadales bacterium]